MIDSKDLLTNQIPKTIDDDDLIDSLLDDNTINHFVMKYDMTRDEILMNMNVLMSYKDDTIINEKGQKESKSLPGFVLTLSMNDRVVKTTYTRIGPKPKETKIQLCQMPKELAESRFEDFQVSTDDRRKAYAYARKFINLFGTDEMPKGLYITGNFKSGKTYLASAIGNEIADKGYSVMEVFCPEISSVLKESVFVESDYSFNDIVNEMKSVDLLILDDFAGETVVPRIRDEAFLVVLNYRMIKKKPIIITSNAPMQLISDIMVIDSSKNEKFKATRLCSRISEMCEQIPIKEKFVDDNDIF